MKIYLIRHGETDWNLAQKLQGREDIKLNENGISQAQYCGKAIEKLKVDCIYTSPLSRAMDTARIIADHLEMDQIQVDENIIERDFGEASGITYQLKREKYHDHLIPGLESVDEVRQRMLLAFGKYEEAYPEGSVLVVTHGAAIKGILSAISKDDLGLDKIRLKNTGITIIEAKEKEYQILNFNLAPEELSGLDQFR